MLPHYAQYQIEDERTSNDEATFMTYINEIVLSHWKKLHDEELPPP